MKQFQMYVIGNALVDIEFQVNESTIEQLQINKGVMTLIDEAQHHMLMRELDGVEHLKACGGSAANTLFTLQQLGAKTFYSCKLGNDEAGDFFYHDLVLNGIQTNLHEEIRDGITGKCIVLVTPDADRTMNTFLGATADFSIAQLSEAALKNSEYIYIEGYLVASPTGREAATVAREMAEKHHVKTALTLSDPNMVIYFKEGLLEMIGKQVDIIFCNEREALLFTETDRLFDAQQILKKYARTFVITLGGEGAIIYDGHEFTKVPGCKVHVVDTVGAGDVFAGAFLYGIIKGHSYVKSAELANLAAAKVVSKFGPRLTPEHIDELRNFILNTTMLV